jgi:AcrR family transcriptional regulator
LETDSDAAAPAAVPRKRRADSQRNRDLLADAAKAAFAELGAEVSLDEIARRAGVGIGTLYRHFPNRGAILEAVYERELDQFAGAAAQLLETMPPGDALHAWMRLFVDYIATKKVIAPAIAALADGTPAVFASSGTRITSAMAMLVARAGASGDIRAGSDPNDLLRALVGFTYGNTGPGWEASAKRLIDILMDGLRAPPSPR